MDCAPAVVATRLTRHRAAHPALELTYVALDVETTGLNPATDRVVEVGWVVFTGRGNVLSEFVTLLNVPGSPEEVRRVHRIEDEHLIGAPSLADVWPLLVSTLAGRVLVAHNLPFDLGFLSAEAARAGLARWQPGPAVCTLETARRHLDAPSYSMKSLHKTVSGGWRDTDHTALGDAHACADVTQWLLATAPSPMYATAAPTMPARPHHPEVPQLLRPEATRRRPPPWEEAAARGEPVPERPELTAEERAARRREAELTWTHLWRDVELQEDPGPRRRRRIDSREHQCEAKV